MNPTLKHSRSYEVGGASCKALIATVRANYKYLLHALVLTHYNIHGE